MAMNPVTVQCSAYSNLSPLPVTIYKNGVQYAHLSLLFGSVWLFYDDIQQESSIGTAFSSNGTALTFEDFLNPNDNGAILTTNSYTLLNGLIAARPNGTFCCDPSLLLKDGNGYVINPDPSPIPVTYTPNASLTHTFTISLTGQPDIVKTGNNLEVDFNYLGIPHKLIWTKGQFSIDGSPQGTGSNQTQIEIS